jgi:hypothetical protein
MIDTSTLQRVGGPIAAQLIPGWEVTWIVCTQAQIDTLIPGALAVCRAEDATPTRSLAKVYVIDNWPESESLAETLWHELTHAWISPLIQLIPDSNSAGSIMLEEQLVERMGKLLAKVPTNARLSMLRAVDRYVPRLRARISALAPRARSGGRMDPKLIGEALDALIAGDTAKCAEILKQLVTAAAGGDAPAPATEPDGDEATMPPPADAMPAKLPEEGAKPGAGDPKKDDADMARTRARVTRAVSEIEAIAADQLKSAKSAIVEGLRARLPGHTGLPGIEAKIAKAPTYAAAKDIAEIAESMGGGVQRARSGADHQAMPDPVGAGGAAVPSDQLAKEGFAPAWIANYEADHKRDPKLAAHGLTVARARMAPNASPWLPSAPAQVGGAK